LKHGYYDVPAILKRETKTYFGWNWKESHEAIFTNRVTVMFQTSSHFCKRERERERERIDFSKKSNFIRPGIYFDWNWKESPYAA